jgi:small subunit ribosomal protein S2
MAEQKETLIAVDQYLKAGIHIGTKFKTKQMEDFIYKIRSDGLYILNLEKVDERIRLAAKLISQYAPEDVLIASRRENGWKPIKLVHKLTGITVFAGRYIPGTLTNTALEGFMEKKIVIVTDPFPDKNVVQDAQRAGIPVVALCDTNNETTGVDFVVPCNNKGKKSLGLFFYLVLREYMKNRGLIASYDDFKSTIEEFTEE